MEKLKQTPSQTIGPFFAYSLTAEQYGYAFNSIINGSLLGDDKEAEQIFITGKVFDGKGNAVSDALIELWQADTNGNYISEILPVGRQVRNTKYEILFTGFGRLGTGTNEQHSFTFKTIKPGVVKGQAPHINVILFMRGSLHTLYTRIYFSDELNDKDPLFNSVDAIRKKTLIAQREEIKGSIIYHFDIHMQGESETVFFEV